MNKKGMTLVEVIVAMVIVAALALAVTSLISPLLRSYETIEATADAQMIGESLMKDIRAKTNYTKTLSCTNDTLKYGEQSGEVKEIKVNHKGYLEIAGVQDFDDNYYMDMTVALTCETTSQTNQVKVKLSMLSEGKEVFAIDTALKPLKVAQ